MDLRYKKKNKNKNKTKQKKTNKKHLCGVKNEYRKLYKRNSVKTIILSTQDYIMMIKFCGQTHGIWDVRLIEVLNGDIHFKV